MEECESPIIVFIYLFILYFSCMRVLFLKGSLALLNDRFGLWCI
jgi:hypothetical protein